MQEQTANEDPVVLAAQAAFAVRIRNSNDVSENTKNAQAIAKAWRSAVHQLDPDRFQIEALVAPELDQKIDVIDIETASAYEFKVSGKNAWAEFYKDVVKVIMWNERRSKKIPTLVFITEEAFGRPFLDAPDAKRLHRLPFEARTQRTRRIRPASTLGLRHNASLAPAMPSSKKSKN
jgi:hypothetical protein